MKVKVNTPITQNTVVSVGVQGPSGVTALNRATDVDLTNLEEGSVLVYKMTTNKWTSTTTLDAQDMEGGEF